MKKYKNFLKVYLSITFIIFLSGCYTDTIDSFSEFTIQLPIYFHSYHYQKGAPDTSITFANLNEFNEYRENKKMIDIAQVYSFNYWVDSIHVDENVPFDPKKDTIIFDFIRFYIQFAIPKNDSIKRLLDNLPPNHPIALDSSNWMPDTNEAPVLLGEYLDVNIAEYFRNPQYISKVAQYVTEIITEIAKHRPQFYVTTMYSKVRGQTEPKRYFPLVWARYDLILRMTVKI